MTKELDNSEKKDEAINTIDIGKEDEEMEKSIYTYVLTILNGDHFISLKLINEPFGETMGETLLRFFSRQIINANEILNRNYYIHFNINDINPDNLLNNNNLFKKFLKFSLLSKIKEMTIGIPGCTQGYLTLEFYINPNESIDNKMKQNYYDLGSTLFFLKNGYKLLSYKKSDNPIQKLDIFQRNKSFIYKDSTGNQNFIDYLCSLISPNPKDKLFFEDIYTNKWLNEDAEKTEEIVSGFENENDEEKLIMELQKRDYLIKKENETKNGRDKNPDRHCKFRFKKKSHLKKIKK